MPHPAAPRSRLLPPEDAKTDNAEGDAAMHDDTFAMPDVPEEYRREPLAPPGSRIVIPSATLATQPDESGHPWPQRWLGGALSSILTVDQKFRFMSRALDMLNGGERESLGGDFDELYLDYGLAGQSDAAKKEEISALFRGVMDAYVANMTASHDPNGTGRESRKSTESLDGLTAEHLRPPRPALPLITMGRPPSRSPDFVPAPSPSTSPPYQYDAGRRSVSPAVAQAQGEGEDSPEDDYANGDQSPPPNRRTPRWSISPNPPPHAASSRLSASPGEGTYFGAHTPGNSPPAFASLTQPEKDEYDDQDDQQMDDGDSQEMEMDVDQQGHGEPLSGTPTQKHDSFFNDDEDLFGDWGDNQTGGSPSTGAAAAAAVGAAVAGAGADLVVPVEVLLQRRDKRITVG
ncbi:unnamed protein product [Vitrella brassicaformis CCMP3155]|uniref:Uncharacterized protein n=2 Tax=Vitrella brassicaformis TaxID=1169539 RepID=A0A0G4H344_VITBC|nr:unnamed protein product [Vitrella brassicaformis CCMP3155]|eukprot:CEM38129.1 unnamed protein product [Vitrella brassicaformis CCMP3155]